MIFVTRLLYTNNDNMEHLNKNQNKEYGHYVWKHGKGPQTMTFCSVLECQKKKKSEFQLNADTLSYNISYICVLSTLTILWYHSLLGLLA